MYRIKTVVAGVAGNKAEERDVKFGFLKSALGSLALLLVLTTNVSAAVIFSDDFNTSPDWNSQETLNGTSPGNILWGSTPYALQAPANWSDYRSSRGGLPALGERTYQVNSKNGRGGNGKGLTAYYETINNWAGGSVNKYLGPTGYDELYVRWYRKFEPGWQYRTKTGSAIHKLFRLLSNVDDPHGSNSTSPQDMYKVPNNRPDWKHNCDVSNGGTGGSTSGTFDPATGTYMCGKQSYLILLDRNLSGNMGWGQITYNPEGRSGSVSDLTKNFDAGSKQVYWKDYHGKWTPGTFPGSYYQGGDWVGNGEWVAYEIHAKMNDVGSKNFLFELFINGEKVGQVTDLEFRKEWNTKFNYLMLSDNMLNAIYSDSGVIPAGEGEQWLAIDDLVVSTHYSGPPPQPTGVAAAAGSAGSVKVTWSAGSNGAVYPLNGYRIHYGTDAANLSSTLTVGNVTEATVSNLAPGSTYYFAVTAYNKGSYDSNENVSKRSNVVSAATSTSTAPPPATDTVAPVVSISAPADAATVSGTVNVTAAASDNVGVSKVEFYVNGTIYGVTGTAPYSIPWNTTSSANGSKTLTVKAYDAAGNAAQSSRTVNVSNATADTTAPVIGSFSMPASATSSTVAVSSLSATDNVGVTGYFISESAAAPTATNSGWRTTAPTSFTFAGTGARTAYLWARDAAGNLSTSRSATVSISSSVADATLPTVYLTAPTYGGQLAGTAVFSANASDNVGVTRVEFFVNGVLTGTDTSAPYSYSWNSTTVPNGSYNVSAKAYDAAGNVGVAATKPVTVANSTADTTVPTVGSFSIAAVSRSLTVPVTAFAATDNVAVTGYLISESSAVPAASATGWRTAAPTSFTFAGTGSRTAYAWAKDAAGNVSARRSATVTIDTELPKITSLSVGSGSSVTIKSSATDNLGVTKMQLYVDGTLKHQTTASYFSYVWSVPYRGTHNITVKAYDAAGNVRSVSANVTR